MYKLGYSLEIPERKLKSWFYEIHSGKQELLSRASQLANQPYVTKITISLESEEMKNGKKEN